MKVPDPLSPRVPLCVLFLGLMALPAASALFCDDTLYEAWLDCGGGQAPQADGCCASTQRCPEGCRRSSWGSSTGCSCTGCPRAPKLKLSTTDQYLNSHNFFRCRHGQALLEYSTQVAANAQAHARQCNFAHSDSYSNNPSSGENLAYGYSTHASAIEDWYKEVDDYTPNAQGLGACAAGKMCGHYTAMMWDSTKLLGCGYCESESLLVCQYADSPPNFNMDSMERLNVPQTNTPTRTEAACCALVYNGNSIPDASFARPAWRFSAATPICTAAVAALLAICL